MKYFLIWSTLILSCTSVYSQKRVNDKIHYHNNKQISTIEVWDKDKRNGKFLCMNAKGDTLIKYHLRTYGGHASAYVSYFPNGQAKKVELSDAPDGGIQFYNEIIYFDEHGKETYRSDLSYPHKLTVTF